MNTILETTIPVHWLYVFIAALASMVGCAVIVIGPSWSNSSLRNQHVKKRQRMIALIGILAFSTSHILIPISMNVPITMKYYGFHLVFTIIGCYGAVCAASRYAFSSWRGSMQFFVTSIIVALTILVFDYANTLYLFRGFLIWQPELILMTIPIAISICLAVMRLFSLSSRNREHGLRSPTMIFGIITSGMGLAGIPLLCAYSVLSFDQMGLTEKSYLVPYIYMIFVAASLYAIPDSFIFVREQKENRAMIQREQYYSSLYEQNPDSVIEFDINGVITGINRRAQKMSSELGKPLIGVRATDLLEGEQKILAEDHLELVLSGHSSTIDLELKYQKDRTLSIALTSIPIFVHGKIEGAYTIIKNITKRKRDQETIRHLAYHDELTGLANRRSFETRLSMYTMVDNHHSPFTLFFIDLDRFKRINDLFGHAFGDAVIRHSGLVLKSCLPKDSFVARMGGDEFTVIIPGLSDIEEIKQIANKVVERFVQPFHIEKHAVKLSASIGIARFPEDGASAGVLTQRADTAMYTAKENGSSQYQFYDAVSDQSSLEQIMLENDLEQAIDNNQLKLVYQPKFDIRTGLIIGYEALVRWYHPILGEIPPLSFIPLAEKSGMIIALEQWVLRTACLQSKKWQWEGYDAVPIAVNVSPIHLMKPDIYETIIKTLQELDFDPTLLEIEITESAMMHNEEHVIDILSKLKQSGISVSMDDFGTGYSSLSYLHNLPIGCLKIDRSFIRKITIDKDSRAIAEMIISMAKQLGLKIIAEGVETEEQVALLKEWKCYNVQGFYYSRPLAPENAIHSRVS